MEQIRRITWGPLDQRGLRTHHIERYRKLHVSLHKTEIFAVGRYALWMVSLGITQATPKHHQHIRRSPSDMGVFRRATQGLVIIQFMFPTI
jgi:hypothetical protein